MFNKLSTLIPYLTNHHKKYRRYFYVNPYNLSGANKDPHIRFIIKVNGKFYLCAMESRTTNKALGTFISLLEQYNATNEIFKIARLSNSSKLVPVGPNIRGLHISVDRECLSPCT
ncbi:MAG: hypothetical protein KC478_13410 [Bacteriovoracaceae bacterium]|nr:hypothetical protein [Bacteriovoracaceae bacterium]